MHSVVTDWRKVSQPTSLPLMMMTVRILEEKITKIPTIPMMKIIILMTSISRSDEESVMKTVGVQLIRVY